MVFFLETEQALLWIVPVLFQMFFGLISYPMVVLAWWVELFWLLFVHPHPSSALSDRKQKRSGNQSRKSVPRFIRRFSFQRIKFESMPMQPSLTSLPVIGSQDGMLQLLVEKIDNDGVDSLGVMAQSSWHTHLIFSIPYNYVARRLPRPPDTLLFVSSWCLMSYIILGNLNETILF